VAQEVPISKGKPGKKGRKEREESVGRIEDEKRGWV
jgi:hypothetical protein